MYASYQDYVQRFGGRAIPDEAEFNRLAPRAGAVLDRLSYGRAARYRDREGKLALACCAVTEKLYEQEELRRSCAARAGIASEKVGDWQVRYRAEERTALATELEALAEMYLFGTGLLYRGVPVGL
jgi:hypothetical protein